MRTDGGLPLSATVRSTGVLPFGVSPSGSL